MRLKEKAWTVWTYILCTNSHYYPFKWHKGNRYNVTICVIEGLSEDLIKTLPQETSVTKYQSFISTSMLL